MKKLKKKKKKKMSVRGRLVRRKRTVIRSQKTRRIIKRV
jgi:hypothetical protein